MSKLLPTRLPLAFDEVTPELFNRLVRILEINLGEFDPDNVRQMTTAERDQSFFNAGSLIFNVDEDVLQCYDGTRWRDLFNSQFYVNNDTGFALTASLGTVTVTTA